MAGASDSFHEPVEELRAETMDRHRAIVSLQEECEAVDWYDQRIDACGDPELAEILRHNRDEEKEHAAMTLEWLRRRDPEWDEQLRAHLFTTGPIADEDDASADREPDVDEVAGDLGIRSLHGGSNL